MKLSDIRLSTRITVAALIIVVSVAFLLIFIAESQLQKAYFDEQRDHIEQNLHTERQSLNLTVGKLRSDVLFLSSTPPVSGILRAIKNGGVDPLEGKTRKAWEKQLQEIFSAFAANNPEYYRICYIGLADEGRELVRVDRRDGTVKVIPPAELGRRAGRDYFKAASTIKTGQIYLSGFDLDRESVAARPSMSAALHAAVPVSEPDGEPFGMVVINMEVGQLFSSLSQGLSDNVRAYVASMNGNYLLHPDTGETPGFAADRNKSIIADFPTLTRLADRKSVV